jgi:hypothetical protein
LWSIAKALHVPLDKKIKEIEDIPYTLSFIIRKRIQLDNLNELPKDKRPPERTIWEGSSKDIDDWIDKVFDKKKKKDFDKAEIVIMDFEVE